MLRSGPAFWELWACGHSLQGCSRAVLTFGRANKWPLGLCQATRQPGKTRFTQLGVFPFSLGLTISTGKPERYSILQDLGWCQACWYLTALPGTSLSVHLQIFAHSPASLWHPPLGPHSAPLSLSEFSLHAVLSFSQHKHQNKEVKSHLERRLCSFPDSHASGGITV